jgi:hypothetical protein
MEQPVHVTTCDPEEGAGASCAPTLLPFPAGLFASIGTLPVHPPPPGKAHLWSPVGQEEPTEAESDPS